LQRREATQRAMGRTYMDREWEIRERERARERELRVREREREQEVSRQRPRYQEDVDHASTLSRPSQMR
jgi:hypothetical protein